MFSTPMLGKFTQYKAKIMKKTFPFNIVYTMIKIKIILASSSTTLVWCKRVQFIVHTMKSYLCKSYETLRKYEGTTRVTMAKIRLTLTPIVMQFSSGPVGNFTTNLEPAFSSESFSGRKRQTTLILSSAAISLSAAMSTHSTTTLHAHRSTCPPGKRCPRPGESASDEQADCVYGAYTSSRLLAANRQLRHRPDRYRFDRIDDD